MRPAAGPPKLIVELDGAELAPEHARALSEVRVQQRLSLPALCEIGFREPTGDLASALAPAPGTSLAVRVEGPAEPLFAGEVTAVEYEYEPSRGRMVRIRGYDLLHRLRKRQPVRAHVQVSAADLARELVADLQLSVEAESPGPLWGRWIQYRQSDLDLLGEVCERCGLYFTLRDGVLHLLTLEGVGPPVPLRLGESLLEVRVEVNGDPACRSVSASGWDPSRGEPHRGSASTGRIGRSVSVEAPPDRLGGSGERTLVDEAVQDDAQTEALAQAELDARLAREVALSGVAEGDPRLRPGTPIEVGGLAERLSGRYVLTEVNHLIEAQRGFVSEISTSPAPPRTRPRSTIVTTGIVTRVDDPDGLGRVQVSLPAYEGVETGWMGVVMAGAGVGKGLLVIPDVDDQVLVLFPREDPAQGIVLGSLYGARTPPDVGVEEGRVRRVTFRTPGGQLLRLDDTRKSIRIENTGGSFLELTPEGVALHAEADVTLEAPGRNIVIRGKAIDFQQG